MQLTKGWSYGLSSLREGTVVTASRRARPLSLHAQGRGLSAELNLSQSLDPGHQQSTALRRGGQDTAGG